MKRKGKFKPSVPNRFLVFSAGMAWTMAGGILMLTAVKWLSWVPGERKVIYAGAGVLSALLIHHFGFLRIVDRNLARIFRMNESSCMFSFFSWKSYLLIALMIFIGIVLRHSPIPKAFLSVLYIGIGLALVLSSIRYLRTFFLDRSP